MFKFRLSKQLIIYKLVNYNKATCHKPYECLKRLTQEICYPYDIYPFECAYLSTNLLFKLLDILSYVFQLWYKCTNWVRKRNVLAVLHYLEDDTLEKRGVALCKLSLNNNMISYVVYMLISCSLVTREWSLHIQCKGCSTAATNSSHRKMFDRLAV